MLARLTDLPFIVVLLGISALAMFVPAAHALGIDDPMELRESYLAAYFTAFTGEVLDGAEGARFVQQFRDMMEGQG